MTGLVADGALLLLVLVAGRMAARRAAKRGRPPTPPDWRRLWRWAAPVLALGVPAVTMTANEPTLGPRLAAMVTLVALAGLALALLPLPWAIERPRELACLSAQGAGIGLAMMGWRAVELPGRGVLDPRMAASALGASLLGGLLILAVTDHLRAAAGVPPPGWRASFTAALAWLLLVGPLAHHLFFTPPRWRYITAGPNVYGHAGWVILSGLGLGLGLSRLTEAMAMGRPDGQDA